MSEREAIRDYLSYMRDAQIAMPDIQARVVAILTDPEIILRIPELPHNVIFAHVAAFWQEPDAQIRSHLLHWLARQEPMAEVRDRADLARTTPELLPPLPEPATVRRGQWRGVPAGDVALGAEQPTYSRVPRPDDPRAMRLIRDMIRDAAREAERREAERRERQRAKRPVVVTSHGGTVSAGLGTTRKRKRKRIRKRKR